MNVVNLTSESLHIWHIPLDAASDCKRLLEDLSKEEQVRTARFAQDASRDHYILAHSAVRHILAGYLGTTPAQLQLTTTEYDKPVLLPDQYPLDLRFNLSHCRNLALLAVTLEREVGIDLEHLAIPRKTAPLTRRYFTDQIVQALSSLDQDQQKTAFLRLWTQFEAYKKALGTGLRGDKTKLSLNWKSVSDDQFRALFEKDASPEWQVAAIKLSAGWIASVVLKADSDGVRLEHKQYRHPH